MPCQGTKGESQDACCDGSATRKEAQRRKAAMRCAKMRECDGMAGRTDTVGGAVLVGAGRWVEARLT